MQKFSHNDKRFWNILNKMKDKAFTNKPPINPSDIINHFQALLQSPKQPKKTQMSKISGPLDDIISCEEVLNSLKGLKNCSSSGIDSITNKIMKEFVETYPEFTTKLFNYILKSDKFPSEWSTSILVPIHKKGSKSSITNYRGISLIPVFCKLFCSILNKRIVTWASNNKILSPCQLGFVKGNRTSDALILLHNSISDYCHKGRKKLYSCFVDFEKAFDKIPRDILLHKIHNLGITGNVFNIIASMYSSDKCCIKIGNRMSSPFSINQGVRQGCVLSPTLFNLFLSDFEPLLAKENNLDRVTINANIQMSSIIWADDILMLSETKQGLQNQLDFLEKYSNDNQLKINVNKTKCLCFNTTGKLIRNCFHINNSAIEDVNYIKYLGFVVSSSGSTKRGIHNLSERAHRASFILKSGLGSVYRKDVFMSLQLFDKIIKPILLYASDFWGCYKPNLSEKSPIELAHSKICKDILGVSKYTSNAGTRYELGRKPIFIDAIKHSFNNWLRIAGEKKCHNFLLESTKRSLQIESIWTENIKTIIESCGMGFLWNKVGNFTPKGKLTKLLYKNLWNTFNNKITTRLAKPMSRLHHLFLLKATENDLPNYFLNIKNVKHRTAFSKLRLMDNNNNNITRKDKLPNLCSRCLLSPKSPKHLLIECPVYSDIRKVMFDEILLKYNQYKGMNSDDQILFLMGDNKITAKIVAKFAYGIFCFS